METTNGKNEQQEPFIAPSATHHHHNAPNSQIAFQPVRRRRYTKKCAICCCLLGTFLLLIVAALLVFFIWIWPNACFVVLDDPSAPVQLGINLQRSRLFVILSKPLETGAINSSINICGEPSTIDTSFLMAFGGLRVQSAKFTMASVTCQHLPLGTDVDQGTLKFIIDGGHNETTLTIENLDISFARVNNPGQFFDLSSDGNSTNADKKPPNQLGMVIGESGRVKFDPPIGVIYSNFMAVTTSEISLIPASSRENFCGAPVIGIQLPEHSLIDKAWSAFQHWASHDFPPISWVGISHFFNLLAVEVSHASVSTQPLAYAMESDNADGGAPVFMKKGNFKVGRSKLSITNLTVEIDEDENVFIQTLARLQGNISSGNVEAIANLRRRLELEVAFRDSILDSIFDVDLSILKRFTDAETLERRQSSIIRTRLPASELGSFKMHNLAIQSPENSSVYASVLSGVLEPIYIRSFRHFVPTPDCMLAHDVITLEFVTANMTVPSNESLKVMISGQSQGMPPLAINLYKMGRVANDVKFIVATFCLEQRPVVQTLDIIYPRSEKLLTGSFNYSMDFDMPATPEGGMKLQTWSFNADGVDARVSPLENFLQIDKLAVKLNSTQNNKANLDLQVSLKQSPWPFFRAFL